LAAKVVGWKVNYLVGLMEKCSVGMLEPRLAEQSDSMKVAKLDHVTQEKLGMQWVAPTDKSTVEEKAKQLEYGKVGSLVPMKVPSLVETMEPWLVG
jgi:hypothetical protein